MRYGEHTEYDHETLRAKDKESTNTDDGELKKKLTKCKQDIETCGNLEEVKNVFKPASLNVGSEMMEANVSVNLDMPSTSRVLTATFEIERKTTSKRKSTNRSVVKSNTATSTLSARRR